jgi:hypothetical protein
MGPSRAPCLCRRRQAGRVKIFFFTEIRNRRRLRASRLDPEGRSRGRLDREPGMRWTRQRRARKVRAGRVVPGEPVTARGRAALTGSFRGRDGGNVHDGAGPNAKASEPRVRQNRVVLAVVRHGQAFVDAGAAPTGAAPGDFHQGEGGQKEASAPGRARHKPSDHRAGKAGCSATPVCCCAVFSACAIRAADRGCRSAPGLPCALLIPGGGEISKNSGE